MIRSRLVSTGIFVPDHVVKNDDLKALMDTSDEWIVQRTGIKQRHWVNDLTTATSDLALEASKKALQNASLKPSDIDMIFLATLSPDHEFPGTACFLQAKLGAPGIPAIDIRQQCTGFVYSMAMADNFIRCGQAKRILIVGAEIHSRGLDRTTRGRDVAVLFGDGAGAAILEAVDVKDPRKDSYIYSTHLHADGKFAQELWIKAPGMGCGERERMTQTMIDSGDQYPAMNGKAVFVHATKRMPEAVLEALNANQLRVEDVDLFVFHQANLRINEMVAKQLKIPEGKVFNTIDRFANTTAATLPIGMDEAVRAGVLKKGMIVAGAAFGSGFTWASFVMRW